MWRVSINVIKNERNSFKEFKRVLDCVIKMLFKYFVCSPEFIKKSETIGKPALCSRSKLWFLSASLWDKLQ